MRVDTAAIDTLVDPEAQKFQYPLTWRVSWMGRVIGLIGVLEDIAADHPDVRRVMMEELEDTIRFLRNGCTRG